LSNLEGERERDAAVPSAGGAGAQCPATRNARQGNRVRKEGAEKDN